MRDEKEEREKQACTCMYTVLLCLVVCLTLLASFFLPFHPSLNMYVYSSAKLVLHLYAHVNVDVHVHVHRVSICVMGYVMLIDYWYVQIL